jgi:hypothetical protein
MREGFAQANKAASSSFQGGGELVDVMRVANRTKDYTNIDALIREHIPKFLYNDGEGKLVTTPTIFLGQVCRSSFSVDNDQ